MYLESDPILSKRRSRKSKWDKVGFGLLFTYLITAQTAAADVKLLEMNAPFTKFVGFRAPAAVAANQLWTLPSGDGSANQCLATNGSGSLIWKTTGGGSSLDASDGSPTHAVSVDTGGKVGIGTTAPASQLDVAGEIKLGNSASVCNGSTEGQQRYNSTTKTMEFCIATAWTPLASAFSMINTPMVYSSTQDVWNYSSYVACPAGYTLQFYGLRTHYAGIIASNYHYCDCSASGNSIRVGTLGSVNANYSCSCSGLCTK